MNGIFYLIGLILVGVFVLEALVHSPETTIKKSGVPGLIQIPWQDASSSPRWEPAPMTQTDQSRVRQ